MNWGAVLSHLWATLLEWWPRVLTAGGVGGAVWGTIIAVKTGVVGLYFRTSVLGKEQDRVESNLMATLRKMVELEKEHHVAEVALVRTQVAEALAEKDVELAKLRAECQALRLEVGQLRALLEKVAHGELATFDRRSGVPREGTSADRAEGGADHGV